MSPSISNCLLSTQSDARLVELTRQGHERAFEALVQRYRRPLLRYCRGLRLPEERAEDALQQALLGAWLALRAGTEVRAVKPWLYRVAHNAAVNVLRVAGNDHAELSDTTLVWTAAPQEELDRQMALREAFAGLAALPQLQRAALLQTAVEGHSHEDVASSLGVSEGALRGLVYRARASLRAAATVVTPGPLIGWLTRASGASQPFAARLAELGAGGGSVGLAGVLMKSGALVLGTGVLVGGIAVHHHGRPHRGHPYVVSRHVVRSSPVVAAAASSTKGAPAPQPHTASRRVERKHPHERLGRSEETSTDDRGGTGGEGPHEDGPQSSGPSRGGPGPSSSDGGPGSNGSGNTSSSNGGKGGPGGSGGRGREELVVGGDLLSQEGQREDHEDAHHDQ